MPLVKKNIPAPLAVGVDAGGNDPLIAEGKNLKLSNTMQPRRGVVAKRYGTHSHSNTNYTGTYGDHYAIAEYKGGPALFAHGEAADVYRGADANDDEWKSSSDITSEPCTAVVERTGQSTATSEVYNTWDIASNDTHTITVANGDIRVYDNDRLELIEQTNDTTLIPSAYHGIRLLCTANGTLCAVHIYSNSVRYYTVDSNGLFSSHTDLNTSSTPSLTADPDNTYGFDACPLDGDKVGIAYASNGTGMRVFVLDVVAGTISGQSHTDPGSLGYSADEIGCVPWRSNNYWAVMWVDNTNNAVMCQVFDNAAASAYSAVTVTGYTTEFMRISGFKLSGDEDIHFTAQYLQTGGNRNQNRRFTFTQSGGSMTAGSDNWSQDYLVPVSRPWVDGNNRAFQIGYFQGGGWLDSTGGMDTDESTTQRTYVVYEIAESSGSGMIKSIPIGTFLVNNAGVPVVNGGWAASDVYAAFSDAPLSSERGRRMVPGVSVGYNTSGTEVKFHCPYLSSQGKQAMSVVTINTQPDRVGSVTIGDQVAFAASIPYSYANGTFSPQGIFEYPEYITVASAGSSGTWSSTGSVGFVAVWKIIDGAGRTVRSIPSLPVSFALSATTQQPQVTVYSPVIKHLVKSNERLIVEFYRTDVNGSEYYKVEERQHLWGVDRTSTAFDGSETLETGSGDTFVPLKEVLYTRGGVPGNAPPRNHSICELHQNRYFCNDNDNPYDQIFFSREIKPNDGIPHQDFATIPVPHTGGKIVGIKSHGGNLYIFKERAIYATSGEGPSDTLTGSFYYRPSLISAHIGCEGADTIVEVPQGLMFLSQDGIYLLSGTNLQFVGHDVRYYTDNETQVSATVHPDEHIAIWVGDTNALVYDYLYQQWSTWSGNWSSLQHVRSINGILWGVGLAGNVFSMDTSKYTDGNSGFTMTIETQWYDLAGLLGEFQLYKTYVLGYSATDCTFNVQYQYDKSPKWYSAEAQSIDTDTLRHITYDKHLDASGDTGADRHDAFIIQVKGAKKKAKSIRFKITTSNSGTGTTPQAQSVELVSLVFVVGQRTQAALIGDTRKAT